MSTPRLARPERQQLERQSEGLASLRGRLLRRVQVARCKRIVDLGAGTGAVTGELVRRGGGEVIAIDAQPDFEDLDPLPFAGATRICCDAAALPFADGSIDLVFCQLGLLWMPAERVLDEVARVLAPGGAFVSIEVDIGGLLEHPPERSIKDLWLKGLRAAGADPDMGRKVAGLVAARGLNPTVQVLPQVAPAGPERIDMLRDLPLSPEDHGRMDQLAAMPPQDPWSLFVWAPVFGLTATKAR